MAVLKKEFSTPNYLKLPQLCGLKTDLIEEILFTYIIKAFLMRILMSL